MKIPQQEHSLVFLVQCIFSVIRYILQKIYKLQLKRYEIEFCWVPSHVGIQGNEKADGKAVEASKRNPECIPIYYKDYHSTIKSKFFEKSNSLWQSHPNPPKIHLIKSDLSPWPQLALRRREEVVVNRLRIGHTNITHKHLMDSTLNRVPPICHFCSLAILTVKHIFVECPALTTARQLHFSNVNSANLIDFIGINANIPGLLSFLRANHLFSYI